MTAFRLPLILLMLAFALSLNACGPRVQPLGQYLSAPVLTKNVATMADGTKLPIDVWSARTPKAILIGVHGMNGYAADFNIPGPWFAKHGVTVYAYDQRSFGRTASDSLGIWPGDQVMIDDLKAVLDLVQKRHPKMPVYILGLSMGGAIAMAAIDEGMRPEGVILAAPAVWGWRAMNPFLKSTLWVTAHVAPAFKPSSSNLEVWPSDNIPMLKEISRDPLYLKETRTDAIYGLVGLMDRAYDSAERLDVPVLYLYGKNDQIVPADPSENVMKRIPQPKKMVIYGNGWHMIMRDKQRKRVWRDIMTWLENKDAALPSGEEVTNSSLAKQ
ncbi:MAG: lysophospholipase [Hyphomicrobiales bacterium]